MRCSAVQKCHEDLGNCEPVVFTVLARDLLQPVHPTRSCFRAATSQLIDGTGEPLTRLSLPGQRLCIGSLITVFAELFKSKNSTCQNGQATNRLQRCRTQVILQSQASVCQLERILLA
ncbi:hypothetical protein AR457_41435 [Streptomyces agglomeratus]|uniref:Uncharacterized protein n=1 Tax=Streptomyces agglomeratus TaxID=285458 RepID=A0A1E5NY26_9ACTN|nr:hypothetical protein AR457_41435 [Streptomyces agglomeratus]OEJ21220.1 hypothetical protein AS594_36915 [Streptomyces agglomeratus]OEJ36608.1 hypothetical protein BGK72_36105 [Streptomyces agglomeratus]OEJ56325.1 hypothetical protein BGM19_36975 [Streptomyces agglomeratus]